MIVWRPCGHPALFGVVATKLNRRHLLDEDCPVCPINPDDDRDSNPTGEARIAHFYGRSESLYPETPGDWHAVKCAHADEWQRVWANELEDPYYYDGPDFDDGVGRWGPYFIRDALDGRSWSALQRAGIRRKLGTAPYVDEGSI